LATQRKCAVSGIAGGGLFLFKLHSPDDYIVGGGFFSHFTILPAVLRQVCREKL
jgi:hypothetical protein